MSYNPKEAELSVLSTLSEKKIFQDNTTVKYKHQDTLLPEDYNGLGYLNLFAIIFDIRIKLNRLAKKNNAEESPTPLNLLLLKNQRHIPILKCNIFSLIILKNIENLL